VPPQTTVKCTVNTCTHYLRGDRCGAANIDILHDQEDRMPESSEHTECKTFYKKGGVANMLGSMNNVNWQGVVRGTVSTGSEVNPSITCVVDNCRFWAPGNECHAEVIEVSGKNANECRDTKCATFEQR